MPSQADFEHGLPYGVIAALKNHCFTQIPDPQVDLTGRTCLVTGTTAGLGFDTIVHFAKRNAARLILPARNAKKAQDTMANLYKTVPSFKGKIDLYDLDMSNSGSVIAFANKVNSEVERIDICILNAGISAATHRLSKEGFEDDIQTNVVSTGLLAMLLLPKLAATSKMAQPTNAISKSHLVIVASDVHGYAKFKAQDAPGKLLAAVSDKKYFSAVDQYNVSKLLDVFITREIAKLDIAKDVVVNCTNPGLCVSALRDELGSVVAWIINKLSWSGEFGTRNFVIAATRDTKPGAYVSFGGEYPTSKYTMSAKGLNAQKRLWEELVQHWREVAPEVGKLV